MEPARPKYPQTPNPPLKGLPRRRDSSTLSFLILGPDFSFFTRISSFLYHHNVFQTQYFPLKFSGSLEHFLKRSIPGCLVQKHLENPNISENFTVLKIDDPKFYLVHPSDIFSQKDPGFVRFRSILNDPQNLSKKYWVWKKLEQFYNQKKMFFSNPVTPPRETFKQPKVHRFAVSNRS